MKEKGLEIVADAGAKRPSLVELPAVVPCGISLPALPNGPPGDAIGSPFKCKVPFGKARGASAGSKPPYESLYEGDLAWRYAPTCGIKVRTTKLRSDFCSQSIVSV